MFKRYKANMKTLYLAMYNRVIRNKRECFPKHSVKLNPYGKFKYTIYT